MSSFRAALREELRPKSLLLLVVAGAVLAAFTDVSASYLAYVGALAILASAFAATTEADVVDDRLARLLLGLVVVAAGGVWLSGRTLADESVLAPAVGVLIGVWIALDGLANYRADLGRDEDVPLDREPGAVEVMRLMRRAHDVFHALDDDEPRTVAEVAAEADADPGAVAEALDVFEAQGMVERRDGGYVANSDYRGRWRSTATNLRAVGRRIARPVAILSGRWSGPSR